MTWVTTAILSAAIMGMVNIFDSHLLTKRIPSLRAFLLPVGVMHLFYAFVLFALFPLPEGTGIVPVLIAVTSGLLRFGSITILLYSLKKEEVSRVIPVVHTYPIFVSIVAIPLLGESLYYLEWLAIVIVVAGAVMVSLRQSPSGSTSWQGRPFITLLGSSLLFALADITGKYALNYLSVWNVFYLTTFCIAGLSLLISLRPHIIRQLAGIKNKGTTWSLLVLNETVSPIGIALSFWALQRGPVSLVSTVMSSRPMFVVLFALILNRVLPKFLNWNPGEGKLPQRLIATAMIVGGIVIIHLM
ncbi:EamA family transporter [Chloroflexota bacterium]